MQLIKDGHWTVLEPLINQYDPPKGGRGRPRADTRQVLEGILWICRTGARWQDLPKSYPPYQTCHRRFQRWNRKGLWDDILAYLVKVLAKEGKIDLSETFIDGTFSPAKKGALVLAKLKEAKAPKSWALQIAMVFLSPYTRTQPIPTK